MSSGSTHICGLREDSSAACWGDNDYGQSSPPEGETFTAMSSGTGHTCGLRQDGSAVCWGYSLHGQSNPTIVYGRQNCVRALARGPLIPYHCNPQVEFEFHRAILAGIPASRPRPPQEGPFKV